MASRLRWVFDAVNRLSGPARQMAGSLSQVESRLKATDTALKQVDRTAASVGGALRDSKGRFLPGSGGRSAKKELRGFSLGLGSIGDAAQKIFYPLELAKTGMQGFMEVGRVAFGAGQFAFGALGFKESMLASFKILSGSGAAAERIFGQAKEFARKTPFETKTVVESFQRLLTAGFSEQEIPVVFQAMGDLSAMRGFDQQVLDSVALTFSQIKGKGRLQGEELMQLAEKGVPTGKVYEKLGKIFGTTRTAAEKLITAGKVDANTGIFAILDAMRETISGGKLGNVILEQSKTLSGLLSTLRSAPTDFFLDMDLSKLKGFESFKGFIQNLTKLLDTNSASGKRLKSVFENLFESVSTKLFGPLSGPEGLARMERGLTKVTEVTIKLIEIFDRLWTVLKPILSTQFDQTIATPFNVLHTALTNPGKAGGDAVKGLLRATNLGFLAKFIPQFGDGGVVNGPTLAIVGEKGPEAIVPLSGGRQVLPRGGAARMAGGVQVSMPIHIDARGIEDEASAERLAARVRSAARDALASVFDELAVESGALGVV